SKSASLVSLREVIQRPNFQATGFHLPLALGNDVSGAPVAGDLTRMPHLLIAGATGQGKSVCINALISSLLFTSTPDRLRLMLIDPKRVEMSSYNGLPHLMVPVMVETHQAAAALRWAVAEMDRRYKLLSAAGVRNIQGYKLYMPVDAGKATRLQGAFVSDKEVDATVGWWKGQGDPRFMEEVLGDAQTADYGDVEPGGRKLDPLFARAARAVAAEGGASVSLVQRKFNVGYSRAGRIVDQLADYRVIGGYQGSKSREVLMNLPDVDELLEQLGLES